MSVALSKSHHCMLGVDKLLTTFCLQVLIEALLHFPSGAISKVENRQHHAPQHQRCF